MADIVNDLFHDVEVWHAEPLGPDQVRYLSTGLRDLDKLTGGLQPGLYLSGARPSVGKTALWSNIARNVAQGLQDSGKTVLYFTNEMKDTQLATRLVCAQAQIQKLELEQGRLAMEKLTALYDGLDDLRKLPLNLIYARDLASIVSRCYQEEAPALIVVDYLNKLHGGRGENRNQQYGAIADALFDMAYDLQCPVVLLCQLNRDLTKRGKDALPEMEDLRDSGELEQIADVILLLDRKEDLPTEMRILKRKDRLGGGQHTGCAVYFSPYAGVANGYYGGK
jgi:replicative DNA helicase